MAVVLVVVVLLTALVASSRGTPIYESRALVSVGTVADKGANSLEHNLAVARDNTGRLAGEGRQDRAVTVHVRVVDGTALEFRVRGRDAVEAADAANAYAHAYVELRRKQLMDDSVNPEGPESGRRAGVSAGTGPSVVVPADPASSPLSPWPSEAWAVAGMALIALALALPNRE